MARHRLDIASLVSGLAFVIVGAVSLVGDLSLQAQLNLIWPLVLAVVGITLLFSGRSGGEGAVER